tara:strand:+ start:316 stop:513 length:198 start_codon:yes stop_codon:yes gene_type:complete
MLITYFQKTPSGVFFLCINTHMNDKQAAKKIIKIAKKHPNLYTKQDVRYAKLFKKRLKNKKNSSK